MRRAQRSVMVLCLVCGSAPAAARHEPATPVPTKQVAAPPSDIVSGLVRLPEPESLGIVSRSALVRVDADAGVWSHELPAGSRAVLLPASPDRWRVEAVGPTGVRSELAGARAAGPIASITEGGALAPNRSFQALRMPANDTGWSVRVTPAGTPGWLLVEQPGGVELYTYRTSLDSFVGSPITLRSELSGGARVVRSTIEVRSPSGAERSAAADGPDVSFVPDEPGDHAIIVRVEGRGPDARTIERTTQHLIATVRADNPLAPITVESADGAAVFRFPDGVAGRRSIIAAEVWGRRGAEEIPVCFLSRVCDGSRSLSLDLRWVSLAGVEPGSITLRRVRAHDADGMSIVVPESESAAPLPRGTALPPTPDRIEPAMLTGVPGGSSARWDARPASPRVAAPGHRLMLVHGYCSDGNPFAVPQFSGDLAEFSDPNQNRSIDAFALELLSQSAPMKSFGVAAHSQGGMAALHLSTFYWSGMDWSRGERLIQSVGTPYQGTALAGNAAVLGDLFGSGCGSNADMTYTGAALWLSTIPTWARQRVWYWTTSFEDRPFQFDFCNFITDLLLTDPDDGVIERSAGQLPGATNMGHRPGWCHTVNMSFPPQCTDAQRNAEISERARR